MLLMKHFYYSRLEWTFKIVDNVSIAFVRLMQIVIYFYNFLVCLFCILDLDEEYVKKFEKMQLHSESGNNRISDHASHVNFFDKLPVSIIQAETQKQLLIFNPSFTNYSDIYMMKTMIIITVVCKANFIFICGKHYTEYVFAVKCEVSLRFRSYQDIVFVRL